MLERPIRLTFDCRDAAFNNSDETLFTAVAGTGHETLGFQLTAMPPAPYLVVEKVTSRSWAYHAGVRSGDHLIAVYRWRTAEISEQQLMQMFNGPRPVRLTFSRLKRFTATIGGHERQMGVQTNSVPPAAFLEIRKVEPGTWGERAGIFVGDSLVAVNGTCLDAMSRREFIRLMKEERPLSLTLDRNQGANSVAHYERFTVTAGAELQLQFSIQYCLQLLAALQLLPAYLIHSMFPAIRVSF